MNKPLNFSHLDPKETFSFTHQIKTVPLSSRTIRRKTMSAFTGNYAAAEIGIFWDLEDCKIGNMSASETLQNIRLTISRAGHHGTVSIRAYGDMSGLEFPSDGIKLNHFPAGERYARHTKILEDIVSWSSEHPEPSNLMLIMKDNISEDLIEIVELLKSRKKYMFHLVN